MALSAMECAALGQATNAEHAAAKARRDLLSWKEYAQQLNESLKNSQIDTAMQAVIKEECLRELFLLDPNHRLHVKANRQAAALAGMTEKLGSMGVAELADDKDRIAKVVGA